MKYVLRVWLTVIICSPMVFWFCFGYQNEKKLYDFFSLIPIVFFSMIVGFILSVPTMIFFYFANDWMEEKNVQVWKAKMVLGLVLSAGVFATFAIIDVSLFFHTEDFIIPASYMLSSIAAVGLVPRTNRITA